MTAIRWYRERALLAVLVAAGAGATLGQTGSSLGGVGTSRGKSQMDGLAMGAVDGFSQSAIRVFPGGWCTGNWKFSAYKVTIRW